MADTPAPTAVENVPLAVAFEPNAEEFPAVAAAFVPHWHELLVLRALEGLALGGVPAVAMAWLAEEMHPDGLGLAMGLYVGGTAIGGMAGRVITGVLTDLFGWRIAVAAIGALGIGSMLAFRALLPPSRHFVPKKGLGFAHHRAALLRHFARPGLPPVSRSCPTSDFPSFISVSWRSTTTP